MTIKPTKWKCCLSDTTSFVSVILTPFEVDSGVGELLGLLHMYYL